MAKKDNQGSYELVDRDLEQGFPESSDPNDASLIRNKFDIITGPKRSKFSFRSIKRRKSLIWLLVLVVFLIAVAGIHTSGSGLEVLDYYKNKVKGSGEEPEVQNEQSQRQSDGPVYEDNDEPLVNAEGQEQQQDSKPNAKVPEVAQNDGPTYEDNDNPLKVGAINAEGEASEVEAPKAQVVEPPKVQVEEAPKAQVEEAPKAEAEAPKIQIEEVTEETEKVADKLKEESAAEAK